jgi:hypothetical protein
MRARQVIFPVEWDLFSICAICNLHFFSRVDPNLTQGAVLQWLGGYGAFCKSFKIRLLGTGLEPARGCPQGILSP